MNIIAVDPGNTTGLALWYGGPKPYVHEIPGGFPELVRVIDDLVLNDPNPWDLIVVEDWIIDDKTHTKTRQPAAMYGTGYVKGVALSHGIPELTIGASGHKPRSGVKKLRRDGLSQPILLGWAKRTSDRHGEDACSLLLEGLRRTDRPTYDAILATILPEVNYDRS